MNMELYAGKTVDELIRIKDRHRDILLADEINALNNAANLIYKNRDKLEKK